MPLLRAFISRRTISVTAASILISASPAAFARAHGKHARAARAAKAKPAAPVAAPVAPVVAAPAVREPVRPLTLEEVRAAEETPKPVAAARIRELVKALDALPENDPQRAARSFDLARAHAEQERYYRFKVTELSQKLDAIAGGSAAPEGPDADVGLLRAELADDRDRRAEWLQSATTRFEQFTANAAFADYRRMDQALVTLINLYLLQKNEEAARPLVKRLVTSYKESLTMPDAYLAFAEYFFDAKDWEKAVDFYGRVLKFPASVRFDYARYKLAWAAFYQGDYRQAMKSFVALVSKDGARTEGEEGGDRFARGAALLAVEARKAAVWTYAKVGAADQAWNFFAKAAPAHAKDMMSMLADDYSLLGKTAERAQVYRALAEANTDAPERCDWLGRAYEVAKTEGGAGRTAVLQEMVAADEQLADDKGAAPAEKEACAKTVRAELVAYTKDWNRATAGLTGDDLNAAIAVYRHFRDYVATREEREPLDLIEAQLPQQQGKPCDALLAWLELLHKRQGAAAPLLDTIARGALTSWDACLATTPAAEKRASLAANMKPDAAAVYARAGDPARARAFFESVDPEGADDLLKKLAAIYAHDGRRAAARVLLGGKTGRRH